MGASAENSSDFSGGLPPDLSAELDRGTLARQEVMMLRPGVPDPRDADSPTLDSPAPDSRPSLRPGLIRPASLRPSPLVVLLVMLLAALLPNAVEAQGYGYARAEDPLIVQVKAALSAAKEGSYDRVDTTLEALAPFVREVEEGLGVDVGKRLRAARKSKQHQVFGFALCELVYHQVRWKLEANLAEKLSTPTRSRARIEAARSYYEEILSLVVKLADSKHRTEHHTRILADFAAIRSTVGSEGLFGVGAKDPDPSEYRTLGSAIIDRLESIFPQWARPRPGDLGGDPPEGDTDAAQPDTPADGGKGEGR